MQENEGKTYYACLSDLTLCRDTATATFVIDGKEEQYTQCFDVCQKYTSGEACVDFCQPGTFLDEKDNTCKPTCESQIYVTRTVGENTHAVCLAKNECDWFEVVPVGSESYLHCVSECPRYTYGKQCVAECPIGENPVGRAAC